MHSGTLKQTCNNVYSECQVFEIVSQTMKVEVCLLFIFLDPLIEI